MRASDFKIAPAEASLFHGLAGNFLGELGFTLINDPSLKQSRFSASVAAYQSDRGLTLSIGFEPGDSNSAVIHCGWSIQQERLPAESNYSRLAKRFSIDLPLFYTLGYGMDALATMKTMVTDLQRSLPVVLSRMTSDDLYAVARDRSGCSGI